MHSDSPPSGATARPRRGRPRRDPAQSDVRNRLLRAGLEHLTERGYSAVGIDEILKAAAVPKGSFYHYFASKADFASALIAAYDGYFQAKLRRHFDDDRRPPLERLRGFLAEAEAGMARHDFRRGCLIGNLGQEMGALPEAFRTELVAVLDRWQALTAALLRAAQAEGSLAAHHDPEALAAFFWIGWEGAVLRAKLEGRAAPLHEFATPFLSLLTA